MVIKSKGERTKGKLVEKAVHLIAKHGFLDTSFQMIADSAKLSQGAVMHQFGNKLGLATAVVEYIVSTNHELVSSTFTPQDGAYDRLYKHMDGNIVWTVKYPEQAQITVLLYYLACFEKEMREVYLRFIVAARERILAHLLAGEREGIFKLPSKAEVCAESLHDALVGALVSAAASGADSSKLTQIRKKLRLQVERLTGYKKK